jgi:hypothetical protein
MTLWMTRKKRIYKALMKCKTIYSVEWNEFSSTASQMLHNCLLNIPFSCMFMPCYWVDTRNFKFYGPRLLRPALGINMSECSLCSMSLSLQYAYIHFWFKMCSELMYFRLERRVVWYNINLRNILQGHSITNIRLKLMSCLIHNIRVIH